MNLPPPRTPSLIAASLIAAAIVLLAPASAAGASLYLYDATGNMVATLDDQSLSCTSAKTAQTAVTATTAQSATTCQTASSAQSAVTATTALGVAAGAITPDKLPPLVFASYATAAYPAQSIPPGTHTVVNFETRVEDTHGAVTTGPGWRFTVPAGAGGLYLLTAVVTFGTSLGDVFSQMIAFKNGYGVAVLATHAPGATGHMSGLSGSAVLRLQANDLVDVRVAHSASTAKLLWPGDRLFDHLEIVRLGR